MRGLRTAPQLNSKCPHRFEETFVEENFIGEGELGAATYEPEYCPQFVIKVLTLGLDVLPPSSN